jgi:putative membrane protein
MPENDPRVFFAAERTLLAWVRTAIGLIGLGFVVARFGLFLRLVRAHGDGDIGRHIPSMILGVGLALAGAALAATAAWQHHRFCRSLSSNELPPRYSIRVGLLVGLGVAVAGLLLAVELLL